jgi:hypothetical protein
MTTPTIPSPADLPRAGMSLAESLRRHELAEHAVAQLLAPPGTLERLAAEQGVQPITDIEELTGAEGVPEEEAQAFLDAIHELHPAPSHEPKPFPPGRPLPRPPFGWIPGAARQPNPLARDQYVRRAGLELAVRFYADTDGDTVTPADVLATARSFAEFIRTGQ